MGEQKMPGQNPSGQPGKPNPQQDQTRQPNERASTPERDVHDEAARRQSRQDPLQNRGR